MVPALVRTLVATNDLEIIRAATATLHNISYYAQGREAIFKCGGVPVLVKSLGLEFFSVFCGNLFPIIS